MLTLQLKGFNKRSFSKLGNEDHLHSLQQQFFESIHGKRLVHRRVFYFLSLMSDIESLNDNLI